MLLSLPIKSLSYTTTHCSLAQLLAEMLIKDDSLSRCHFGSNDLTIRLNHVYDKGYSSPLQGVSTD